MMSEQDFDLKLKHIEEQYHARKEGAEAYRDQEVARLFQVCEWTQERIAKHMGKKQSWVCKRLCFGRFLSFIPTGNNSVANLTERRFRDYWSRTKGKEADRFAEVARILETGIPTGYAACLDKPGVRKAVLAVLDDGKTYTVGQIVASVEDTLPGVTSEQIRNCLRQLRHHPPAGQTLKTKNPGRNARYRLTRAKPGDAKPTGPAEVLNIYEMAKPLIEELHHWGRTSKFNIPPIELEHIAIKLERLFEAALTKEPA